MEAQLLDCFSHPNKRRLLNLLRYYPLTLMDAVKVLDLKKSHVSKFLKEFTQAGLIQKETISHKLVIYQCISIPDMPKSFDDVLNSLSKNKARQSEGKEQYSKFRFYNDLLETDLDKFIIEMYQIRGINDPGLFPDKFIGEVFRMFKISNDPQFAEDINRYNLLLPQLKSPEYIRKEKRNTSKRIREFLAKKEGKTS